MLLQPNFVLPEFFMHTQFPDAFRADSSPAAVPAVFSSTVPPMLQSSNKRANDSDGGVRLNVQVSALDILMKHSSVQELFLQNQMEARRKAEGVTLQNPPMWTLSSPSKHSDGQSLSPRRALHRKQAIVESLHGLVQSFQAHTAQLLKKHAAKLSEYIPESASDNSSELDCAREK